MHCCLQVSIVTGGCSINMLHGYCTNLESSLLRENITPVSSDDMSFIDITENEYEIKKSILKFSVH